MLARRLPLWIILGLCLVSSGYQLSYAESATKPHNPLNNNANTTVTQNQTLPAGKVLTVHGMLKAIGSDNSERQLKRRSEFYESDTLVTDDDSQAQIRFRDDSVMALKPGTEFEVLAYQYDENEPQKSKQVGRLIKGGFRALSGKIGQANPNNYRIETPVATIGIRGTNYTALLMNNDLSVAVWEGVIRLSNQAGSIDLGDGFKMRYGQVIARNERPEGLIQAPPELEQDCPSYQSSHRN